MSEDMPEDMPDRVLQDMPEHIAEDMPGRMPEDMPDRMPEDMSDRMPEDLPVTKCIDVMVGITRSKVFFLVYANVYIIHHGFWLAPFLAGKIHIFVPAASCTRKRPGPSAWTLRSAWRKITRNTEKHNLWAPGAIFQSYLLHNCYFFITKY